MSSFFLGANFHAIQLRNDLDKLNVSFANEKSELNSKIANAEQRYNEMNEKYLALKVSVIGTHDF